MNVTLNCITQPLGSMSAEEYIIYAARLSSDTRVNHETAPKLLKYMINHKHWSPFEMISIGIEITTSRAIAQQLLRHRSFSFQEFSQRYAEVTDMEDVQLRMQAKENRQSSTDEVDKSEEVWDHVHNAITQCQDSYKQLLAAGVAKECARMVLPLTTETTLIMHGTLRSWIHLFEQRCSEHAQLETQQIAYAARDLIAEVCPWTAKALEW
jgi:thymidylate synthase (FAD)